MSATSTSDFSRSVREIDYEDRKCHRQPQNLTPNSLSDVEDTADEGNNNSSNNNNNSTNNKNSLPVCTNHDSAEHETNRALRKSTSPSGSELANMAVKSETLCRVCGDISSGRHYGQFTCDGCSGFFMRSVRKNMVYRCKGSQKCIVDKRRRNQCQACRYQKCLDVNMNRYAVQQERQPNCSHMQLSQTTFRECPCEHSLRSIVLYPGEQRRKPYAVMAHLKLDRKDRSDLFKEAEKLKEARKEGLYESATRLLHHSVKWPRSVPAFTQLSPRDQFKLLEEGWPEIFLLFAFQWNLLHNMRGYMGDNGFTSRLPDECVPSIEAELRRIEDVASRFRLLDVTEEEFIYLKSVVLFKPETRGLLDPYHVERCQDRAQIMLRDHVLNSYPEQTPRFGKLLLLLPEIRRITPRILDDIFFRHSAGHSSFEALLADIFKS